MLSANTMWSVHYYEMHWHACMETPLPHSLTLSHHLLRNILPEVMTWLFEDTHVRTMFWDIPSSLLFSPKRVPSLFPHFVSKGLDTLLRSKNRIKGVFMYRSLFLQVCGVDTNIPRNGCINKLTLVFHGSILLLIMNFFLANCQSSSYGSTDT